MSAWRLNVSWIIIEAVLFHIAVENFGRPDVKISTLQKVGVFANAAKELVQVEGEHLFYLFVAKEEKCDILVNAVRYTPAPYRLEQMAQHEIFKEKRKPILKNDSREDCLLTAIFRVHRPDCLDVPKNFESMSDGHLGRIKLAKNQTELLDDHIRIVDSVPHRAVPTTRTFSTAGAGQRITRRYLNRRLFRRWPWLRNATQRMDLLAFAAPLGD